MWCYSLEPKCWCTKTNTCEKSPPLYELFYFELLKFLNLNLFHIE